MSWYQRYKKVGGGVKDGGNYYDPGHVWYFPTTEAMQAYADATGQTLADVQSQYQNLLRARQRLMDAVSSGDYSQIADMMPKFETETMMNWLDRHGGLQQNVIDPGNRIMAEWEAQTAPTLRQAVFADPSQRIAAGDASPSSKVFDQTLEAAYQQQHAAWKQGAVQAAYNPFFTGVQSGYENYNNARNQAYINWMNNAFQQGFANPTESIIGSIIDANAGGYTPQLIRRPHAPPLIGSVGTMPAGSGFSDQTKNPNPSNDPNSKDPNAGSGNVTPSKYAQAINDARAAQRDTTAYPTYGPPTSGVGIGDTVRYSR